MARGLETARVVRTFELRDESPVDCCVKRLRRSASMSIDGKQYANFLNCRRQTATTAAAARSAARPKTAANDEDEFARILAQTRRHTQASESKATDATIIEANCRRSTHKLLIKAPPRRSTAAAYATFS